MRILLIFIGLLIFSACKEQIPEPVKTFISSPKAVLAEVRDTTNTFIAKPIAIKEVDSAGREDEVFIMLPPVSVKESFDVMVNEQGKLRKVKVKYEIGKDSTREYAQIHNNLDIRFFSEIPVDLDARVESYISRYHTMNTMIISPLKPIITGNLFSFNLEKLQEDKVFNLVIYEAGKKVHSISFEKYPWDVR